jgi:cytosine deaminase
VVIGENRSFRGEEELLRSRGVSLDVVDDPDCAELLASFIQVHPELWNEDIGR